MDAQSVLTPIDLARIIGVSKQRINVLLLTDRIPAARKDGSGRWLIPYDPRITLLSRERPGPVTRYVHDWEQRHNA